LEKAGVQFLNKEGGKVFTPPIVNDIKNPPTKSKPSNNNENRTTRRKIYRRMEDLLNDKEGAKKKYRNDHEVKLNNDRDVIDGLPTLTGKECISDPYYKQSYKKEPKERRVNRGNVTSEEIKRMEHQVKKVKDSQEKKKAEAGVTKSREVSYNLYSNITAFTTPF